MDVVVYRSGSQWATPWEAAAIEGFRIHGLDPEVRPKGSWLVSDVAVVWGHRDEALHRMQRDAGRHYLVLERGHLHDRRTYTAISWDGIGRRGRYPTAPDGERWDRLFGDRMKPWRSTGKAVIVFGQLPGDASLYGADIKAWACKAAASAEAYGLPVIFRPHPRHAGLYGHWCPDGAESSTATLERDIERAAVAVTFNSTSGIETALAGVPTVCCDEGAMAWPVAAHRIGDIETPDRERWAHDLAWTNWTADEIASGQAWDAVRAAMEN